MGTHNMPSAECVGSRPALRLVIKREATIPAPVDEAPDTQQDGLGCMRGILAAIGFQAAALILGTALWKLLH